VHGGALLDRVVEGTLAAEYRTDQIERYIARRRRFGYQGSATPGWGRDVEKRGGTSLVPRPRPETSNVKYLTDATYFRRVNILRYCAIDEHRRFAHRRPTVTPPLGDANQ